MKRLGALEALGRGVSNVRGNLELVGVAAGGSLVLLAIVLASLVPWLGAGEEGLGSLLRVASGQGGPEDLATLASRSWSLVTDLWGFVLAFALGITVATAVYFWYFAGILGVLYAGDAQAPPGTGRSGDLFRTWSPRYFVREAARLSGRLFWFYSLWGLVGLGILALFVLVVVLAAAVGESAGGVAGFAVGCGGSLPLLFLVFAAFGAMSLGQVELVPREGGVLVAWRAGLQLLGRRLAATISLFALLFVTSMALAMIETGVGIGLAAALAERPIVRTATQLALFVAQVMLSAILNLTFVGAFVALVRSERRREEELPV